jgi:predicted RNA-binding Zn ribbon-like protein
MRVSDRLARIRTEHHGRCTEDGEGRDDDEKEHDRFHLATPFLVTVLGLHTGYQDDYCIPLPVTCQPCNNGYLMTSRIVLSDPARAPAELHEFVPHGHQVDLETGLDFVNTLEYEHGQPVEHLTTYATALHWFRGHDLLHADMYEAELARDAADPGSGERTLARIRRLRAAMRELTDAAVEQRSPAQRDLDEINRALRTHYTYYLIPAHDGVSLDHRHEGDPIAGALARLTESIASDVSEGHPERLRICANEGCRWVFEDTSRTGRRKWCDMSTCGNRAKVARHREKKRAEEEVTPPGPAQA